MNPSISIGFNLFKIANLDDDVEHDDDLEVFGEEDNEAEELKTENKTENVVEKVVEVELEKNDDIVAEIKKIISKSKANGLGIESEEFSFDDMYQFVIRIDKEDK